MLPQTETVTLDRGDYTTCTINLHGATVVSWIYNQTEQLFVSRKAIFNCKDAIRGGIPFVFPQYGRWTLGPEYGFARIVPWQIEQPPTRLPNRDIEASFSLTANEYTKSMWNFDFKIVYKICLREKILEFDVAVVNTSKIYKLAFNVALYTHLKTPDVTRVRIDGLQDCRYYDVAEKKRYVDEQPFVHIDGNVDYIYQNDTGEQMLDYGVDDRKLKIATSFSNVMIWNPWKKDEQFDVTLGFGVGEVAKYVVLAPGDKFAATYKLEIIKNYDKLVMYYF